MTFSALCTKLQKCEEQTLWNGLSLVRNIRLTKHDISFYTVMVKSVVQSSRHHHSGLRILPLLRKIKYHVCKSNISNKRESIPESLFFTLSQFCILKGESAFKICHEKFKLWLLALLIRLQRYKSTTLKKCHRCQIHTKRYPHVFGFDDIFWDVTIRKRLHCYLKFFALLQSLAGGVLSCTKISP